MSGFSFSSLVLSGVQAASGVSVLPPGRYVCKVTDAEIGDTKDGTGKFVVVKLKDSLDKGVITDRINVHNKSEKAVEIGMEQLKALLVHGSHPDPDNIGAHGLGSIKGLVVGVIVGSETYQGEARSRVKGYCDPSTVKGYEQSASTDGAPAVGGKKLPF